MRKRILLLLFVSVILVRSNAQQSAFNQPVQLKSCKINVDANCFIATTVMELEFYNPKNEEVEGYKHFKLNRGQVVTAFQLDLNGRYRDGSIEERRKAANAYNTIVGKRIDPAILEMDHQDNYMLHIYPIAARSSRRVKIIITQLMKGDADKLTYHLPLSFSDTTSFFELKINVSNTKNIPIVNKGLLENQLFRKDLGATELHWETNFIILNKPLSFSVPFTENDPCLCVSKEKKEFILRFSPNIPVHYNVLPKKITVFWDASLSAKTRNLKEELDFLEEYIRANKIIGVTIIPFNQQLQQSIYYYPEKTNFSAIRHRLLNYNYSGATTLGNLDFSQLTSDVVLLFSDGINSYGPSMPKPGAIQINCIVSGNTYNHAHLEKIIGTSGGSIVLPNDINNTIATMKKAQIFLLNYSSTGLHINEDFPMRIEKNISLSGTFSHADSLHLLFGNNSSINKKESFFIDERNFCTEDIYKKMKMLEAFDSIVYNNPYSNGMLVFGLTEKVITPQTAYLVLERIEDYVKYNIAPPQELEEQCKELNYVYKSEYKIKALNDFDEKENLTALVNAYNQKIKWWDSNQPLINLDAPLAAAVTSASRQASANNTLSHSGSSGSEFNIAKIQGNQLMNDVVVTGASGAKKSMAAASSYLNVLSGKTSGLQVHKNFNSDAIHLRGQNRLNTGGNPIIILDGMIILNGNDINPNDIKDITILQGSAAAALFGATGANGAIIINSKNSSEDYSIKKEWSSYNINSMEEVDYMVGLDELTISKLKERYDELAIDHGKKLGFYFDMAQYFFKRNLKKIAHDILLTGSEYTNGDISGLKIVAYILESWKQYKEAIALYKNMIQDFPERIELYRELAMALFQDKQYQEAIDVLNVAINRSYKDNSNDIAQKEMALTEMNAIIALHKNSLSLSAINAHLIKSLPADLRITISGNRNNGYTYANTRITEPRSKIRDFQSGIKANSYFTGSSRDQYYYYKPLSDEYTVKEAQKGIYKISIDSYNYYNQKIPEYVRIMVFRNFQKLDQTLEVQHVILDNQYGHVTIAQVKW